VPNALPTPVSAGSGSTGRRIACLSTAHARSPGEESAIGGFDSSIYGEHNKNSAMMSRKSVSKLLFYRYLIGCRPGSRLRHLLALIGEKAGQEVHGDMLHLTLCVIAEVNERDHFLLPRVQAAFAGQALDSFPVRLSRTSGGPNGAMIRTKGRQDGIQDSYRQMLRLLAMRDLAPLHRKSGLRPHVTLGRTPCRFEPFDVALEWFPSDLLLIESEVGRSKHNVIGRWPLVRRQLELAL